MSKTKQKHLGIDFKASKEETWLLDAMAEAQKEALEAYREKINDTKSKHFNSTSILDYIEDIDINQFINGGKK